MPAERGHLPSAARRAGAATGPRAPCRPGAAGRALRGRLALALGLALALALPAGPAAAQEREPGQITVSAEGRATAAPDMATVSLGAVAEAEDAAAAVQKMSAQAAGLLAALAAAGIPERDVQTSGLHLRPIWSDRYPETRERQQIEGFAAGTDVTVRVRDLDALGPVLDAVVQAGANAFSGLSFGLQEPGPLRDEARRAAVAEAAHKARLYAEAAGVSLGRILSISESDRGAPEMMRTEMASDAGSVPIAQGELAIVARVTITYALMEE